MLAVAFRHGRHLYGGAVYLGQRVAAGRDGTAIRFAPRATPVKSRSAPEDGAQAWVWGAEPLAAPSGVRVDEREAGTRRNGNPFRSREGEGRDSLQTS